MEETTQPKAFKSLAQMRRCDTLIAAGTITKEVFQRDLAATDVESIPWRVGPLKPEDPDQAGQDAYRNTAQALKLAVIRAAQMKVMTDSDLNEIAADDENPAQEAAQQEIHRRSLPQAPEPYNPQGEGAKEGGEGLEAGRPL